MIGKEIFHERSGAKNQEKEELLIIKIGGNVIDNEEGLTSFLKDFSNIPGKKVLVHGGGKIATSFGDKLVILLPSIYFD